MSFIIKPPDSDGFVRILAPATVHPAVCCDVVDRGMRQTSFGMKHKLSLCFLIDKLIPLDKWTHPHTGKVVEVHKDLAGKPFMVSELYTVSMGEKANLRRDLQTWRGRGYTPDELRNFDIESVLGQYAALTVTHSQDRSDPDKWYANIGGISALPDDWTRVQIPTDYVRFKDRPQRDGQRSQQPATQDAATPEPSGTAMTGPAPNFPEGDEAYDDSSLPF